MAFVLAIGIGFWVALDLYSRLQFEKAAHEQTVASLTATVEVANRNSMVARAAINELVLCQKKSGKRRL